MDTKWKNTNLRQKILLFFKTLWEKETKWLLLGILGCFWGATQLQKMNHFLPVNLPKLALKMNFYFALGSIGLMKYGLMRRNKNWDLQSGHFFREWMRRRRNLFILLLLLLGICSALAYGLFYSVQQANKHSNAFLNYINFKNYSIGYILAGTLIFQWVVCLLTASRELKSWLARFLENTEQINQKNVEAAIRSEKMKVDLISNVSHDLKTPLTSMVGYIELMKKEELGDVVADYVEVISNRAQKLKEMIDSLFDLAKTSSGNVELKFEEMEMNCLIEQVMADMAEQIAQSGREMVVSLTAEPTQFMADNLYMYRIVQNLMENALKYSQENTRIFLKTSIAGGGKIGEYQGEERRKVRFEITNTASYRMDFNKEQIVERFARGEESRTTEGNGLGLAIVSTYTAALGGVFDVAVDCDQFRAVIEF